MVNVEVFDVVRKGSGHYLRREEVSEEAPLRAGLYKRCMHVDDKPSY